MRLLVFTLILFAGLVRSPLAWADGRRDLDDGIAFYENLDTERAEQRLRSASTAPDLDAGDRARAFLYLGMLQFEAGDREAADASWSRALGLNPSIEVPAGTSPKIVEAIERARKSRSSRGEDSSSAPELYPTGVEIPPPAATTQPSSASGGSPLVPPPAPESDNTMWWVIGGAGAAAAIAATIVTVVLLTRGGGECKGAGGCVAVTFN